MDIWRVRDTLVCTERVAGLAHAHLRVLESPAGKLEVATDPVSCRAGDWVFTGKGTAGRFAHRDPDIITDLAILGIIDHWEEEGGEADTQPDGAATASDGAATASG